MLRSIWDELDNVNRQVAEALPIRRFALPTRIERPFLPNTEVFAQKADLVVRVELAGIDPERDVKVTLEDGELVIRGERKRQSETKDKTYYRMETSYGTFERHIPLPEDIDEKAVHAEYKDGILEVVVSGAMELMQTKREKATAIPVVVKKGTPEPAGKA
jgi:HSP20 family molecular chaperone IbpA